MQICRRSFTVKEIQAVASNIVLALEDLRKHRVVHRNICAENVLLSRSGLVKLCDLEEATIMDNDSNKYNDTLVCIDPRLQAPELKRAVVDFRTDIWGFGILLLEMYIGFNPLWSYKAHLESGEERSMDYPESGGREKRRSLCLSMEGTRDRRNNRYPRFDTNLELEDLIMSCVSVDIDNRPTTEELSKNSILQGVVKEIRLLQVANFECKDHREQKRRSIVNKTKQRKFSFSQKKFVNIPRQDSDSQCNCNCTLKIVKHLVSEVENFQRKFKKVSSPLEECWLCRTSPVKKNDNDKYDNEYW